MTFEEELDYVLGQVKELLIEKNSAYGDSIFNPIRVFSKSGPLEQIHVRLDDKLCRVMRGKEYPGDDTIIDLMGYLTCYMIQRGRENCDCSRTAGKSGEV